MVIRLTLTAGICWISFLPADAAEPTNYDAEGEYIGPVVDQAQDIRDALTALKAAAADNGTDLAGLKAAILSALTAF